MLGPLVGLGPEVGLEVGLEVVLGRLEVAPDPEDGLPLLCELIMQCAEGEMYIKSQSSTSCEENLRSER